MKQLMTLVIAFFAFTATAQQGFFQTIEANGKDATYIGFSHRTANGDGTYKFERKLPIIRLELKRLPSGTIYGFRAVDAETGEKVYSQSELSDYGRFDSYPNASHIKHTYTKKGFAIIGDFFFVNDEMSNFSMDYTMQIYVRVGSGDVKADDSKKKKKKKGFLSKLKNLATMSFGPEHDRFKTTNLDQMIKEYRAAMKTKQAAPISGKDKAAMAEIERTRKAGDDEIKRYNDSIIATPAHQRMLKHREDMKTMKSNNIVTLKNNTGRTFYVGRSGSRNKGTKIGSGDSTSWNCDTDAYMQTVSQAGGSNVYTSTNSNVYRSNSGCGNTVNIN
jgi:hypothetical protein